MLPTKSYKDLIVWQKGIELVLAVYRYTETLPREEIYGLTSQMRRDSVSIPSNIAEGYARGHQKEFVQFLLISQASAAELDTQLIICERLRIGNNILRPKAESLLNEIQRILPAFIRGLKTRRWTLTARR